MRSVVQFTLAFAAAAGFAGTVGAAATMDSATEPGSARNADHTNVSKVPGPPAPFVPVPYPNMGQPDEAATKKVRVKANVIRENKSAYSRSSGDEAENKKGVIPEKAAKQGAKGGKVESPPAVARQTPKTDFGSVVKKGAAVHDEAAKKTKMEAIAIKQAGASPKPGGKPVLLLTPIDAPRGAAPVAPPSPMPPTGVPPAIGKQDLPEPGKIALERRPALPEPMKPEGPKISPLEPIAPPPRLTPIAMPVKTPILQPLPPVKTLQPISVQPVKAPIIVQPVQPKPMTTLQTLPVMKR
jgi:hypothetical protein